MRSLSESEGHEMRWFNPVVFCATLVLVGSSFATEASALLGGHACVSAVRASCGHVQPRVAPLRACFETHMDHLSGTCASRLSQVADLAKECEADVKNLCGGVQRTSEALDCIKPRLGEVSKRCKDALAKVAVPFAFFQ
jgi:hypothetical protein